MKLNLGSRENSKENALKKASLQPCTNNSDNDSKRYISNKHMTAKEIEEFNSNKYENVYVDGVETKRKNEGFHHSGRAFYRWDEKAIEECLAWWTKPDVIMDAQMRRPDDPNYDKSSIHIPEEAWKTLSSSMI